MKRYLRSFFALIAVTALLFGGAGLSLAAQGSGSLTVLDWAGFDAEEFWIDFKNANPDVDVTFEIGASDADILAKMMAGDQADVFHPYTGWLQFYVDEGLVEELDTSRLTNWDKIPDRFKELGQIDGKQYGVPYNLGVVGVWYNKKLFKQAGIMVVHRRGDMIDIAKIASRQPLPSGPRVRIISNSLTLTHQMLQKMDSVGLIRDPEPELLAADADPEAFARAAREGLADQRYDSVVCAAVNVLPAPGGPTSATASPSSPPSGPWPRSVPRRSGRPSRSPACLCRGRPDGRWRGSECVPPGGPGSPGGRPHLRARRCRHSRGR